MDRRLNSPNAYVPGSGSLANPRLVSSTNHGANIKKTIDILRERLSISPNRAMETIQKMNVSNPHIDTQTGSSKIGSSPGMKFGRERGSYGGDNHGANFQNTSGLSSTLRTDRSYKRYGLGTTPPKNQVVSRNNSQNKKLNVSLNQKSGINSSKLKSIGDKGGYGSGDVIRSVEKNPNGSSTKLAHNIYKPKTKKTFTNPSEILKRVNLDRARAGSNNRSTTPNARDSMRAGLASDATDDRSRADNPLNLSSTGLKRPKLSSKALGTSLKNDNSFTYGDKRSLLTGGRK